MNEYKYGTPEYNIEKAKNSLDEALKMVQSLRYESGTIQEVKQIMLTGKFYLDIGSYYPPSYYNKYDKTKREHVEKAVEVGLSFVDKTEKKIRDIHEKNIPAIENNKVLAKNVESFMTIIGIPRSFQTYEYPSNRHKTRKWVSHLAGYMNDISRCIKTSDGFESEIKKCGEHRKKIEEQRKQLISAIEAGELKKKKEDESLRKLAKAVDWAEKNNIEYSTNEELFNLIDEQAREKWIEENYPDGTELDIKCCHECSSWTVGEHRCSCGNRRMELNVEGNFFDGFTAYPEPY